MANLFAGLPWKSGAFELVTALEILEHLPPDRVAINEAVELAKRFGAKHSAQFVNGILDRLLAGHEKN